jgi:hypothetical protein
MKPNESHFSSVGMSDSHNPYGFRYFDKPADLEEEDDIEEYADRSCPGNCCDRDCECDDCARCSQNNLDKHESYYDAAAA